MIISLKYKEGKVKEKKRKETPEIGVLGNNLFYGEIMNIAQESIYWGKRTKITRGINQTRLIEMVLRTLSLVI